MTLAEYQLETELSIEDAFAELARMGFPPISGGDGEGDGDRNDSDDDQDGDDESGGESALDKERKARKAAEKSTKALQKQIDELNAKDQSELERTKGEKEKAEKALADKEAKLRETVAKSALISEATNAKALRPEAVYKLVKDDAEYDDEGEITNAAALIQAAKKEAPELFGTEQGGGGNGGARDQDGGDSGVTGVDRMRKAYAETGKQKKR